MERKVIWQVEVPDVAAVERWAPELAERLPEVGVVALHGPMGVGKTTWVGAMCRHWGVALGSASPTFGLVHSHERPGRSEVAHWDLYRLRSEEEAWDAGVEDSFLQPILNLVEWPERAPSLLPEEAWLIRFEWVEGMRRVSLEVPVTVMP